MTKIELDVGKYVVMHENGTNLRALRYGQPWRDVVGDGLILALAQRIEELEGEMNMCICAKPALAAPAAEVAPTVGPAGDCITLDAIEMVCRNLIKQDGMKTILELVQYLRTSRAGDMKPSPSDLNAERERFEAAAYAHYLERHAAGQTEDQCEPVSTPESLFWKQDDGSYGVRMFNAAWWGWQAAKGLP